MQINWTDTNAGGLGTGAAWSDYLTIVNTTTLETLATITVTDTASLNGSGPLGAGLSRDRQYLFTLPDGLRGSGQIKVIVAADVTNQVGEFNADGTAEG